MKNFNPKSKILGHKSYVLSHTSNPKPMLLILFFIVVIIALSITKVAISNMVSTTGFELDYLQSEISKYKKENVLLEEKVLTAAALINVSDKAKDLGFKESKSQVYLTTPLPIALGHPQE